MAIEWDENGKAGLGGEFDFTLQRPFRRGPESWQNSDYWGVSLPHQCDSWDVAGGYDAQSATHAHVVAGLERFIVEAQAALAALRDAETGV